MADDLLLRLKRRAGLQQHPTPGSPAPAAWLATLRALLPVEQREHLQEVVAHEQSLVLLVDSAAWAARVRLSLPDLVGAAGGRQLTVKVWRPSSNNRER